MRSIITTLLSTLPLIVVAETWNSCDQWANYRDSAFTVYNNIWGEESGPGPQCVWATNYKNWGIWADHPNTDGIKSYPNVSHELSLPVSQLGECNSSFDVTRPANSGSYSTTYDIWYDNHAYEVMLWMNKHGTVKPISYVYDAMGDPVPETKGEHIGGNTWDIYRGHNGANEVFSFVRNENTNTGSIDITAISNWIKNRGWFADANLHKIEMGFEITHASGGLEFRVNDYNLLCSAKSTNGAIINGATYVLEARHSGKVMGAANGSSDNNANVEQQSLSGSPSQKWLINDAGEGYYNIVNLNSGRSLNVWQRSQADGANIVQSDYQSATHQQWSLVPVGDGYYQIISRLSGKAVDVAGARTPDGTNILQWNAKTSDNQQWKLLLQ